MYKLISVRYYFFKAVVSTLQISIIKSIGGCSVKANMSSCC